MIKKIGILLFFLTWWSPMSHGKTIKEPNVSGQFYPANPQQLSAQIEQFYGRVSDLPTDKKITMIIAPHAGYIYSGPVAAYSFKAAGQQKFSTVVIVAPSHFYPFDTVSVWPEGAFRTPLGEVDVDEEFTKKLLDLSSHFRNDAYVFEREHSLEVEIPFLQTTFKDFKVVPIITGQLSYSACRELADALNNIIGSREDVLVVISTDLSHYHQDAVARKMDGLSLKAVENLESQTIYRQCQMRTAMEMCGFIPVTVALELAKLRGWKAKLLAYGNSGDATGDKDSVVGYGSVMFYQPSSEEAAPPAEQAKIPSESQDEIAPLSLEQKKTLIKIARETIDEYIRHGTVKDFGKVDARLMQAEGAFVTLTANGQLRGCIGNIVSNDPLAQTVRNMAISASTQDPRFSPVTEKELDKLEIEISVLSKPRIAKSPEEVVVGKHGVIVKRGSHAGVFLPQVATEWGWNREEFLTNLCANKAGLPPDAWKDPRTLLEIFTAEVFSEKDMANEK